MTSNLDNRINRHNNGNEKTIRPYAPFKLIYSEKCQNRLEASKRENYFKMVVGKEFIRNIK
jgi:putative endonuclease